MLRTALSAFLQPGVQFVGVPWPSQASELDIHQQARVTSWQYRPGVLTVHIAREEQVQ